MKRSELTSVYFARVRASFEEPWAERLFPEPVREIILKYAEIMRKKCANCDTNFETIKDDMKYCNSCEAELEYAMNNVWKKLRVT